MQQHFDAIAEHLEAEYPREGCGVIAVQQGVLNWFPCTNKASSGENFVIDSKEYLKIKRSADIVGIIHSHPDASSEPSQSDVDHCNALGIPYYIFSYPEMDLSIVEPTINSVGLYGRQYRFGISDCFEAARDYYKEELSIELPHREAFEDDWWLKDLDYFTEEYITTWGFNRVDFSEAVPGSLLIFKIGARCNNHCGVYLGNNIFFHHAQNRLSCREQLDSIWGTGLTGIYNYAT